jgi:hypothetical protein
VRISKPFSQSHGRVGQPNGTAARLWGVPRVLRFVVPAAAVVLIAGCAQQTQQRASTGDTPPASTPATAPAIAPAGYACATANVFTQPVNAPERQQVTLGDNTAVLTGTSASDGVEPSELRGGVLTITQSGRTTVTLPVTAPATSPIVDLFILQTQAGHSKVDDETAGSLCLARFSDGAAPVALLALTTGGAHCCFTVRAVPADGGPAVDHEFGNYAPWFREVSSGAGQVPVLVSADNAFAFEFASFAGSGPPVHLFSWSGGGFTDVTRRHLDLVREDAQSYLASYNDPTQPEKLGFLAGYLADECVVGDGVSAWRFIDQQRQLGHLIDPTDPASASAVAGYEPALRQFVVAHGYCPDDIGQTASQSSSPAE